MIRAQQWAWTVKAVQAGRGRGFLFRLYAQGLCNLDKMISPVVGAVQANRLADALNLGNDFCAHAFDGPIPSCSHLLSRTRAL
jgi:hypothetical protein